MSVIPAPRVQATAGVRAIPGSTPLAFFPIHIAFSGLVLMAGLVALGTEVYEPSQSHDTIALVSGLVVIALIAYARYVVQLPWMSASVVYLLLFWMFHFGMTFTAVLVPDVLAPFEAWAIEWLYWPNVRIAMILGVIGAVGFVFGVGLFGTQAATRRASPVDNAHDPALYGVGWIVMTVGIATSVVIAAQYAGPAIFSMGYMAFLGMISDTMLSTTLPLAHVGCLLAICGAGGRRWVAPLAVWSVFIGVPTLVLGGRAGAMISAVAFAVVLAHRGVRFRRSLLVAAVLASLIVIPAVQAFRLVGFANRSLVSWTEVTPLDTFMELGGSLQATKAYVDWIERGDPYLLGASYWAPFDRQVLVRLVPGREAIPYEEDHRIPSLNIVSEGAVGLSATGEAYYNFGSVGPFLYFGLLGMLFGWLERRAVTTRHGCALLGTMMFLFYFNIRGEWLPIPSQIATNLALIWFCYALGRFRLASMNREPSGNPLYRFN